MDQRDGNDQRRGDEMPQDGLGRDAAHGGREDARYQGGSTGRATGGRSGGDLLDLDADGASAGSARQGDGDDPVASLPRGTDEQSPAPHDDTMAAGGAQEGLDLAERDDVRRRDPSTH